jgi:hypothetical protein
MSKPKLIILLLFLSTSLTAQEDAAPKYSISGYIKNLQSVFIVENTINPFGGPKIAISDNLIHNRLNFRWFPNENWNFRADLRNRFFWGDQPRLPLSNFAENLDMANDYFDLSIEGADQMGVAAQMMLDRLFVQYTYKQFEARLGRQRINWGISTIWNPNDIFNAYNFSDFDYEERPGSDALLLKYYIGYAGSIQLAVRYFEKPEEAIMAGLFKFNQWNYDFQILAGKFQEDLVFGGGWAGNIKNAGFKGEFSVFTPIDTGATSFSGTFNVDYQFSNSLYLNGGFLYNSAGASEGDLSEIFSFELSAKNLYPFETAVFVQTAYPIHPLLNAGAAIIYSPVEANALFVSPTLTYSMKTNWDLDLIGQLVWNKDGSVYLSPVQAAFLRLKWSY